VGQVTFSGEYAGGEARPSTTLQTVRLQTDRAGPELVEIAPGWSWTGTFSPRWPSDPLSDNIRSMDARIFAAEKMGLKSDRR